MSGGHFDYRQHLITDLIQELEAISFEDTEFIKDKETFLKVVDACITHLRLGYIMIHRIDYLLSGDDGEDSFYNRLFEELNKVKRDRTKILERLEDG